MIQLFTVYADGIIALAALVCGLWGLMDGAFLKHSLDISRKIMARQDKDIARLINENRDQNQENRDRHQEVRKMFISHETKYEDRHIKLKERISNMEISLQSIHVHMNGQPIDMDKAKNKIIPIIRYSSKKVL